MYLRPIPNPNPINSSLILEFVISKKKKRKKKSIDHSDLLSLLYGQLIYILSFGDKMSKILISEIINTAIHRIPYKTILSISQNKKATFQIRIQSTD